MKATACLGRRRRSNVGKVLSENSIAPCIYKLPKRASVAQFFSKKSPECKCVHDSLVTLKGSNLTRREHATSDETPS